ncbi:hypothetical protein MYAER_3260 [Microcystis aeruginosa NIES-2549]|jgi:hypothetical protein|uniref:Zinc ribbon domain-containing protein n=2 Tax=Microcystis aeruginosa TaxID=1126 RepID=A0A0F6RMV4_MICAE|nr:zinc ribbon domain-containing protein [Microcystis aeruginosa]AKE65598.1 hypothetical protein MYAER_3260 [Microcystis aeruginosa NIES-2549]AOC54011.1 hypothetical protein amyaer_3306 [Microcystis aeruginosa NIES-2481]GCL60809.1 hypothetical protein NIES3807_39940 [Microcystis aeruginosa NIES-3807]
MFRKIRNFIDLFFTKSRNINNEPVNKISLTVIIVIDLFILINVFLGLDSISRWYLSPSQAYPCYDQWQSYQQNKNSDRDFLIVSEILNLNRVPYIPENYDQSPERHLGKVSPICVNFASLKNNINQPNNKLIFTTIEDKQKQVTSLQEKNRTIRSQYDSSLLEQIVGQPSNLSINEVEAQKAKQELDKNNLNINNLKTEIKELKQQLLATSETVSFLSLLNSEVKFSEVKQGYEKASFWYPSIQIIFQLIFLLPLIFISLFVHKLSIEKGYGLLSLMSWHLLVIFFIPLLIKIFEFLQVGVIFEFIFDIITVIFGGLVFLINYLYIFLIPAIGFGIIKFFQQIVFNPKTQASKRVEKSRCLNCGKKIHNDHSHCPHCGYAQYVECPHCHNLTYKFMPYCYHCGTPQNINPS